LLAKRLGKRRLVAETGAGQHGVATAMAGARHGLPVTIYMGARDMERQASNVARMKLCGAEVIPVTTGAATLKEAIDDALRDWAATVDDTHYVLGTVCGPDPFPALVRDLQAVIGREARAQCLRQIGELPAAAMACVGGGSNAIGLFSGFVDDDQVKFFGAEPGGSGIASGRHGATLCAGTPGLLHGARSYMLQDKHGQVLDSHSVAAGLDYPGVGPEHSFLKDSGRAEYRAVCDDAALAAVTTLTRSEGILPAIESAHALALCLTAVDDGLLNEGDCVVVNLSGRGDKDLPTLLANLPGEES
jgi:tryptophan synthase beta chain